MGLVDQGCNSIHIYSSQNLAKVMFEVLSSASVLVPESGPVSPSVLCPKFKMYIELCPRVWWDLHGQKRSADIALLSGKLPY